MKVPYSQGKTITRNMIPLAVFRINQETKSKYNRKSGGTERFPLNEVSEYGQILCNIVIWVLVTSALTTPLEALHDN